MVYVLGVCCKGGSNGSKGRAECDSKLCLQTSSSVRSHTTPRAQREVHGACGSWTVQSHRRQTLRSQEGQAPAQKSKSGWSLSIQLQSLFQGPWTVLLSPHLSSGAPATHCGQWCSGLGPDLRLWCQPESCPAWATGHSLPRDSPSSRHGDRPEGSLG